MHFKQAVASVHFVPECLRMLIINQNPIFCFDLKQNKHSVKCINDTLWPVLINVCTSRSPNASIGKPILSSLSVLSHFFMIGTLSLPMKQALFWHFLARNQFTLKFHVNGIIVIYILNLLNYHKTDIWKTTDGCLSLHLVTTKDECFPNLSDLFILGIIVLKFWRHKNRNLEMWRNYFSELQLSFFKMEIIMDSMYTIVLSFMTEIMIRLDVCRKIYYCSV